MKKIIDFEDLISPVKGEGLEQLVRKLGQRKNLSPSYTGRGADGGRDLLFVEILSGSISTEKITWLVSCKDNAKSGISVSEGELPRPGILDKVKQHKADGFLLVTTTTPSAGAKALLDSLDISNNGSIHTQVWNYTDLTEMLMQPSNEDLLKAFLPKSFHRFKALDSMESALQTFSDRIPARVLQQVLKT